MAYACPRFVTGEFRPVDTYLKDEEYARSLDCLTKSVSDVLVLNDSGTSVFLGKRIAEPQPDWWMIGGRARPSESPHEAAARNARRELGLECLPPSRFRVIGHYSFAWATREQDPGSRNGTADASTVFSLRLRPEETSAIKLDPKEYSGGQWWDLEDILAAETPSSDAATGASRAKDLNMFHPALRRAILDHRRESHFRDLQRAVRKGADDAEVALIARKMIQEWRFMPDTCKVFTTQSSSGSYEDKYVLYTGSAFSSDAASS